MLLAAKDTAYKTPESKGSPRKCGSNTIVSYLIKAFQRYGVIGVPEFLKPCCSFFQANKEEPRAYMYVCVCIYIIYIKSVPGTNSLILEYIQFQYQLHKIQQHGRNQYV